MARNVNGAFSTFLHDYVNLDKDQTTRARSSRDWLLEQLREFQRDDTFPKLFPEKDIHFGSFARKTKIRPLDDIDLMICLHAQGGSYLDIGDRIEITIGANSNLGYYCYENTNTLNSRKVLNKFLSNLKSIPQYVNAEIKRNLEAATLSLKSYDWVYDIVPCFFTAPTPTGKTYYLIPDGNGDWKMTDPRIDKERATHINSYHGGNVLNVIRTVKYWNRRPTMPSLSSYLLETLILDYYASKNDKASQYVDVEIPDILYHIETSILYDINDPKDIQGNINSLSREERQKISLRAKSDKERAIEARRFENNGDHERSIRKWREIFGNEFPNYG